MFYRHTLASTVELSGVGVHTGDTVTVRIKAAEPGHGIVFDWDGLESLRA